MSEIAAHIAAFSYSVVVLLDQAFLLLVGTYQIGVAMFGFLPMPRHDEPLGESGVPKRFLCLTAAHNEQVVIGPHVENMLRMNYPADFFRVIVIADNCSDNTAAVAEAAGAGVWVRHSNRERGKGYALEWALHRRADLTQFDAVCVFDADNLVEDNFLAVMAQEIGRGRQIIQAHLDTKNPWDSWVTASYAISYWFMNRFWQRARMRLGLSGALGGTGFCVTTQVLRRLRWGAHSLTEDLEFTVRAVLDGIHVHWTPHTKVYDEKPITFEATIPQRTRWLQGHWSVAFDYSPKLLRKALSGGQRDRLAMLDMLIYLWQPVVILATGLNVILTLVEISFGHRWFSPWLSSVMPSWLWLSIVVGALSLPIIAVNIEDVDLRAVVYLPLFYLFNLSWIPITVVGYFRRKDKAWYHTVHSRALAHAEGIVGTGGGR